MNEKHNLNIPCCWLGVGGSGLTLSGGHLRVTCTVAGSGIDVPPLTPNLEYGAGNCLQIIKKKNGNGNINYMSK